MKTSYSEVRLQTTWKDYQYEGRNVLMLALRDYPTSRMHSLMIPWIVRKKYQTTSDNEYMKLTVEKYSKASPMFFQWNGLSK